MFIIPCYFCVLFTELVHSLYRPCRAAIESLCTTPIRHLPHLPRQGHVSPNFTHHRSSASFLSATHLPSNPYGVPTLAQLAVIKFPTPSGRTEAQFGSGTLGLFTHDTILTWFLHLRSIHQALLVFTRRCSYSLESDQHVTHLHLHHTLVRARSKIVKITRGERFSLRPSCLPYHYSSIFSPSSIDVPVPSRLRKPTNT